MELLLGLQAGKIAIFLMLSMLLFSSFFYKIMQEDYVKLYSYIHD